MRKRKFTDTSVQIDQPRLYSPSDGLTGTANMSLSTRECWEVSSLTGGPRTQISTIVGHLFNTDKKHNALLQLQVDNLGLREGEKVNGGEGEEG